MITQLDDLKFGSDGLIPAIVADAATQKVLTLAYMSRDSLDVTLREGRTCFWSRSRQELWRKGESSGNMQRVVDIRPDCDRDALLVLVDRSGPACHTGADSCFDGEAPSAPFSIDALQTLLRERREHPKDGSYTSYLFEKGADKILKKIGEESTEVIIAAKGGAREETVFEIADLAYHVMVLMTHLDISVDNVRRELASRHIVDHKVKQENMR